MRTSRRASCESGASLSGAWATSRRHAASCGRASPCGPWTSAHGLPGRCSSARRRILAMRCTSSARYPPLLVWLHLGSMGARTEQRWTGTADCASMLSNREVLIKRLLAIADQSPSLQAILVAPSISCTSHLVPTSSCVCLFCCAVVVLVHGCHTRLCSPRVAQLAAQRGGRSS